MIINKDKYYELIKTYNKYEINNSDLSITKLYIKNNFKNKKALIWIPGYNDYYYNFYVGEKFLKNGYDIYALHFRRYMQENLDDIFYCDNLKEYIQDIDNIFPKISKKNYNQIVLYGHSMGGLVASIYCKEGKYKDKISHLILNSPFFDFKLNFLEKFILYYVVYFIAYFFPKKLIRPIDINKKNYLSLNIKKRFYLNDKYKLNILSPIYMSWIKTIIDYQSKIKYNNLNLDIPIIILYCNKSTFFTNSNQTGDDTLNVEDINKYSNNLGKNIKKYQFNNAIHDIFSSTIDIVNEALEITFNWLNST